MTDQVLYVREEIYVFMLIMLTIQADKRELRHNMLESLETQKYELIREKNRSGRLGACFFTSMHSLYLLRFTGV